ncbi:MAG: ABC transporter permease [Firmicutes bacterium]|nr:ABC transporter permease [Bacillota bacterium]
MGRYVARRLLQTVILLWLVTVLTFGLILSAPGGPAILYEPGITADQIQQMRQAMGLDQPAHVQYFRWLKGLIRGDMGNSLTLGMPVSELIASRLPATMLLSVAALTIAICLGIPLGVIAAVNRGNLIDNLVTLFSFFGISVPVFWYGLMMIIFFAVNLKWLPAGGMMTVGDSSFLDIMAHLALPAVVIGTVNMAQITRYTRSAMIDVLNADYVRTARAKGLNEVWVLFKHALRNGMIPVITVIGLLLPRIAAGAAVTEQVFAWPGMGQLAVRAAFQRDYPTIMGVTLVVSAVVVVSNLLTDIVYAYVDPRIRFD